jgi:hypothetical protein
MPDGKDDVTLALKEDADIQLFGTVAMKTRFLCS